MATTSPSAVLREDTDIVLIGFPGYGVQPHENTLRNWTTSVVGELRRTLGVSKKVFKTHDFRPWRANGIQVMDVDGIHTFNMLRWIRYDRKDPMVVVLCGPEAWKFKPAIEDAPDHILVILVDNPAFPVREYVKRFYGSNVFIDACEHLNKPKDIWRIL